MNDCIFCRIVEGKIPCHKVYENLNFLAFLDNRPFTEGHTIIVPKIHYRWVYDVTDFGEYWEFSKKISNIILSTLKPEFITFLTMGNEVPHAHIHLIPRYPKDSLFGLFKDSLRSNPTLKDFQNTLKKITSLSAQP